MEYKIYIIDENTQILIKIAENGIQVCIPMFDEKNRDWQEYEAWIAEGNEAEVVGQ